MLGAAEALSDVWTVDVPPPELAAYSGPHSLVVQQCRSLTADGAPPETVVAVATCRMVMLCSPVHGARPSRRAMVSDIAGVLVSRRPVDVGPSGGTMVLVRMRSEPDMLLHLAPPPPQQLQPRKDLLAVLQAVYAELNGGGRAAALEVRTLTDRDSAAPLAAVARLRPPPGYAPPPRDERAIHHNVSCRCQSSHPQHHHSYHHHRGQAPPPRSASPAPSRRSPHVSQRSGAAAAAATAAATTTVPSSAMEELQVRFNQQQVRHQHETGVLRQQLAALKRELLLEREGAAAEAAAASEESGGRLHAVRAQVLEKLQAQATTIASLQVQLEAEKGRRLAAEQQAVAAAAASATQSPPPVERVTRSTSISRTDEVLAAHDVFAARVCGAASSVGRRSRRSASPRKKQSSPSPAPTPAPAVTVDAATATRRRRAMVDAAADPVVLGECHWRGAMVDRETQSYAGGREAERRVSGPVKDMGVMVRPETATTGTLTWHGAVGETQHAVSQTDAGYTFDKGVVTDVAWPFGEVAVRDAAATTTTTGTAPAPTAATTPAPARTNPPPAPSPSEASTSLPDFDMGAFSHPGHPSSVGGGNGGLSRERLPTRSVSSSGSSDLGGLLRECSDLLGRTRPSGTAPGSPRGRRAHTAGAAGVTAVPPARVDADTYWYPLCDGQVVGFSRAGAQALGYAPGTQVEFGGEVHTVVGTRENRLFAHRNGDPGAVCVHGHVAGGRGSGLPRRL